MKSLISKVKITGIERDLRMQIKAQQDKIDRAQKKIIELNEDLETYLANLPPPKPPLPVAPKDEHKYCGKILYPSEKAAHSARKLINRDLKKKGKEPMRRAYLCNICEAWHLTTIPLWLPYPENEITIPEGRNNEVGKTFD